MTTYCLTCRFTSCQARGSEGCWCCCYGSCTGWKAATWPRRGTRPSCSGLTATQPRRRKKPTSHCWRDGFFCRGKVELVGWIATVFREIVLGAMNAVVSSKLNTKWEGWKGEQSPNANVSEFPVCQVKDPYDTVWPPVGDIVFPNLSPKLDQGCWGRPFRGCALCW
jgi:hypothetical protein